MRVAKHLVFLGWALEFAAVDDGDHLVRWRWPVGKIGLYCTPSGRTLYMLPADNAKDVDRPPRASAEAAKRFRTWSAREPAGWFAFRLPEASEVLWKWGYAVEIVYRSDKWNKAATDYIHRFTARPVAYADRQPGPRARPRAWGVLATDGRELVTRRGIVG